jgi:SAM-dependent methyltransferase
MKLSVEVPNKDKVVAAGQAGQRGASGDVPYVMPHQGTDPSEIDRLDIQHYALREHLGANYLAPLEQPARILDVGCGTGLWAYEMCAEFPLAQVVGFDLAPSKSPWPATYRFVRGNLLQGLPFAGDRFDFVHQRLLMSGVPVKAWAAAVNELVRVTRPGGWLELVEGEFDVAPAGPATRQILDVTWRLYREIGLDSTGIIFRSLVEHPRRAGLTDVESREIVVPLGDWGGRIGSLMASDIRALFLRLAAVFEKRFGVSQRETAPLIAAMPQEWEEHHTVIKFAVALGRKPG